MLLNLYFITTKSERVFTVPEGLNREAVPLLSLREIVLYEYVLQYLLFIDYFIYPLKVLKDSLF